MKFDHSDKFNLYHYGQVNSLWLKLSVATEWARTPLGLIFILRAMVHSYYTKAIKYFKD